MAVVGTFIYMATIKEASKRAMHTAVFILTAILAATGATRYGSHCLVSLIKYHGHWVHQCMIVTISDLPILVSSLLLVHLACLLDGYWNSLPHEDLYAARGELTSMCPIGVLAFIVS